MRLALAAALPVLFAAAALADDKVGKTPAPTLLTKTVTDLRKLDGYHFKYEGKVGEYSLTSEGTHWKAGHLKMTTAEGLEMWRKGTASFAKDKNGKWVGAASMGQEAQAIAGSPTPDALLTEALKCVKRAKYGQDEEAGGKECKVIEAAGTEEDIRNYIEAAVKYFRSEYAAFAKRIPLDMKESYMIYRVYVTKDELKVVRVVRDTKIVVPESATKGNPMLEAANGRFDQVLTVELEKHGEGLDEEVPAEVKKLLQIK